jgi:hypothetical protein
MATRGTRLSGALRNDPKPRRLSPGVYRGANGALVNQSGRPIRQQPQRQVPPPQAVVNHMIGEIGQSQPQVQRQGGFQLPESLGNQLNSVPMHEYPESQNMTIMPWSPGNSPQQYLPQMPQPSANMNGQYRLSPGIYGTKDQAMQQYNQQVARYNPGMYVPQVLKR